MPELKWIGKEKVINHHLDVPYRVLDRKYSFDESGQTEEDNGSENMIIHGDNLEALKSLLPKYEGRIDCIYIDPPYNTGEEGWIYNDSVNDPQIKKWLGEVVGSEGDDLSRHDKWLCMMYPRLKLLHRLLKNTGVLLVSVDFKNESHNIRCVLNEIFGESSYVGQFTWESTTQPTNSGSAKLGLQVKTEPIYFYAKDKNKILTFNLDIDESDFKYPHEGKFGKCRFEIIEKSDAGGYERPTMKFQILGQYPREGKRWQIGEDTARELEAQGKVEIVDGIVKKAVYPEDELERVSYKPFWSHLVASEVGTAQQGKAHLNEILGFEAGFDTVKPVNLLKYLIRIISGKNSIVLDSFAGSATTAHAVLDLNKQDDGNRQFILVELMDYAEQITSGRMKKVISGYDGNRKEEVELYAEKLTITKLRKIDELLTEAENVREENLESFDRVSRPAVKDDCLQVIGTKEYKEFVPGTGGSFSYYELGEPLLVDNKLNENVEISKIREYIFYMETRQPIQSINIKEPELLGKHIDTAYYFNYQADAITTLNREWLQNIKTKAESFVIYADLCTLNERELQELNITFKKIPRDITRL